MPGKDLEFMHWCLKKMSAPAITLDCFDRIKKVVEEVKKPIANNDYTKCANEVLKVINYSSDSAHGRKIIEIIKRHFV